MTAKVFKGLDPWNPAAAAREVVSHAMLAAFTIGAGLGYPGLMLVFVAELVLGNLVSAAVYPERGLGRHVLDTVKFLALMAFLLVFVFVTYAAATGVQLDDGARWESLRGGAVLAAIAFAAVHVAVLFFLARLAREPRVAWTRSVLMQNAATLVMLLFIIFVGVFTAPVLLGAADLAGLEVSPDGAMVVLAAGLRLFFALLLTRMPERELLDIARQPYAE